MEAIPVHKLQSLAIIALSTFLYIRFIVSEFGFLPSISKSFEHLKGKQRALFSLFIWLTSIPFLSFAFNPIKPILITAVILLTQVGVYVSVRKKLHEIIHIVGASGSIIAALFSLWFEFDLKYMVYAYGAIFVIIFLTSKKRKVYYWELWAIIVMWVSMLINIY